MVIQRCQASFNAGRWRSFPIGDGNARPNHWAKLVWHDGAIGNAPMVRLFLTILPEGGEDDQDVDYIDKAILVNISGRAISGAREISQ